MKGCECMIEENVKEVWTKGDLKIIYSNPSIYGFEDSQICTSMDDYLYFYYDVTVTNKNKVLFSSRIGTAPLVHYLANEIENIIHFDMDKGIILEDYKDEGFERLVKYMRFSIDGHIRYDYFYKFEREDSYVKIENVLEEKSEYTLTIGNTSEHSESDKTPEHGLVVEIRGLTQEDLINLKEVSLEFCKKTLEQHAEEKRGEKDAEKGR